MNQSQADSCCTCPGTERQEAGMNAEFLLGGVMDLKAEMKRAVPLCVHPPASVPGLGCYMNRGSWLIGVLELFFGQGWGSFDSPSSH